MYDDMHHQVRAPKPWIRWILLIVVLTLVLVIGYGLGVNQAQIDQTVLDQADTSVTSDTEQVEETNATESVSATEDTTAEVALKTFTSAELDYSVQYPADWFVEEDKDEFSPVSGSDNITDYFKSKNVGSPLEMNLGEGDIWIEIHRRDNPERLSAKKYAEKYPGAPNLSESRNQYTKGAVLSSVTDLLIGGTNGIQAAQQVIDSTKVPDTEGAYVVTTYIPSPGETEIYTVEFLTNSEANYVKNKTVHDDFIQSFRALE